MSINNIKAQSTYVAGFQQKQQNMSNLFPALQTGDIPLAQKVCATWRFPVMIKNTMNYFVRLYQAFNSENLVAAQKTALDILSKNNEKGVSVVTSLSFVTTSTKSTNNAQQYAATLTNANVTAQQLGVLALVGIGSSVITVA